MLQYFVKIINLTGNCVNFFKIAREKTKARDVVRKTIIVNDREKAMMEDEKILKAQEEFKKRCSLIGYVFLFYS